MKKNFYIRALSVALVLVGQAYMVGLENDIYVNFISSLSIGFLIGGIGASLNSLTFLKKITARKNVNKELAVLAGLSIIPAIFAILYIGFLQAMRLPTLEGIIPYALAPVFLTSAVLSRPILFQGRPTSLTFASTILPWCGMLATLVFREGHSQFGPILTYTALLAVGNIQLILMLYRADEIGCDQRQGKKRIHKKDVASDLSLVLLQRIPIYFASNYLLAPPGALFSINLIQAVSANFNFIRSAQIKQLIDMTSNVRIRPVWITMVGTLTTAQIVMLLLLTIQFKTGDLTLAIGSATLCSPFLFLTASLPTSGQIILDAWLTICIHVSSLCVMLAGIAIIYFAEVNGGYILVVYVLSITVMRSVYAWKIFKERNLRSIAVDV